jgi:hypothetical protein
MISHPFIRAGLLIPMASLVSGCATQRLESKASAHYEQLPPRETVRSNAAPLSAGDTILISVTTKQGGHLERSEKILDDGSIGLYRLKVAGLMPEVAAAKIREAFIMDLYGFASQISEVKATKVQLTASPNAAPPHR